MLAAFQLPVTRSSPLMILTLLSVPCSANCGARTCPCAMKVTELLTVPMVARSSEMDVPVARPLPASFRVKGSRRSMMVGFVTRTSVPSSEVTVAGSIAVIPSAAKSLPCAGSSVVENSLMNSVACTLKTASCSDRKFETGWLASSLTTLELLSSEVVL